MKISRFVAKAKRVLPRAVLTARGKVLYSAADTLRRGEQYVLGLNPGSPGQFTIAKRLDHLPTKITNDYLDECWRRGQGHYDKRKHPLQRNLDNLLKALGFETRSVCASNLIFPGSEDAKSCDYPRAADKCWPLHQRILDVVRPRVIVAFGNSSISPYDYLRHHGVVVHQGRERRILAGHQSWECKAFSGSLDGRRITVVGLPHLSRFAPNTKPGVMRWLRRLI